MWVAASVVWESLDWVNTESKLVSGSWDTLDSCLGRQLLIFGLQDLDPSPLAGLPALGLELSYTISPGSEAVDWD